jgi:phage terminase small subunit
MADYIRSSDMPALIRLFVFYDEFNRAYHDLRYKPRPPKRKPGEDGAVWNARLAKFKMDLMQTGRIVRGAQGQLAMNPVLRYMDALSKQITALEDRFGFNLATRQKLGLNALRARTLAEQNAMLITDVGDEAEAEAEDPTIAALLQSGTHGGRTPATD